MAKRPVEDASHEHGKLQEERFAAAYVAGGSKSAGAAATSIGLAPSHGVKLLARASVKALVRKNVQWQIENTKMNGLIVLSEMFAVAMSNMTEVVLLRNGGVDIRDESDIPEHARRAIRKISFKKRHPKPDPNGFTCDEPDIEITVEMHDKVGAITALLKHLGIEKPAEPGSEGGAGKKFTWLDVMKAANPPG